MNSFCQIAVNVKFKDSVLTYSEGDFAGKLKRGDLVHIPLGKRIEKGCVLKTGITEIGNEFDETKIKSVDSFYDESISLDESELALYEWMSQYYHYNLGQLIFDCLPKTLKRPRQLNSLSGEGLPLDFNLNPNQDQIAQKIKNKLGSGFSKWLIHGVTGSGKTAVYMNLMQEVLAAGKSVIFLLPEINLTPQFIDTFTKHLKAEIYSYHSSISNSDKYGLWRLLQENDAPKVVIGVRSSLFLPVKKLGLIIVDEEHDQSFKQDDRCPYNARDVAIKKSALGKSPVVLGSATPAMETYQQFIGTDFYCKMDSRIGTASLPKINLIDMRSKGNREKQNWDYWPFNNESIEKMKQAFSKNEQVLVFVNRLGFANYIQCNACGFQFACPNCTATLRFFKNRGEVSCSYCDYKDKMPDICPECGNLKLHQKGFGTEKIQDVLNSIFPEKKVARFDRDEIKTSKQLVNRLDEFHQGDVDILVGTQMLSKGHNFKNVNLVIILGVDSQLNYPDFRACERVYQLLTQVSGRSGRFGESSEVLIHTLGGENKVFSYIVNHEFDRFYQDELPFREMTQNPPFTRLVVMNFTSKFQAQTIEAASKAVHDFREMGKKHFPDLEVLGPKPAFIEKRQNKFTWSLLLRSTDLNQLHNSLKTFKKHSQLHYSVSIKIDVDPYHLA